MIDLYLNGECFWSVSQSLGLVASLVVDLFLSVIVVHLLNCLDIVAVVFSMVGHDVGWKD